MTRRTHAAFARELAKHDEALAREFLEAVRNITSSSQLAALNAAIRANDVEGVFRAMSLGPAFWAPLDSQIRNAFIAGGAWQIEQISRKRAPGGGNLRIGFDHTNQRAESAIRRRGADLVTELDAQTRLGVRAIVQEGIEQGWGAARISRNLIGRQSGNQRTGGIVGLHSRDVDAVIKARRELSNPATLRDYLRRVGGQAPSRRAVQAAINAGRALTDEQVDRVVRSYSNRLLRVRGDRIARTEAHNAFSAGTFEAVQQLIDSGRVPASAIKLVWQSTPSIRTRDTHRSMNGQEVQHGTAFQSPRGALLMYPGDSSLGAPGAETINCRCSVRPVIDFVALAT